MRSLKGRNSKNSKALRRKGDEPEFINIVIRKDPFLSCWKVKKALTISKASPHPSPNLFYWQFFFNLFLFTQRKSAKEFFFCRKKKRKINRSVFRFNLVKEIVFYKKNSDFFNFYRNINWFTSGRGMVSNCHFSWCRPRAGSATFLTSPRRTYLKNFKTDFSLKVFKSD